MQDSLKSLNIHRRCTQAVKVSGTKILLNYVTTEHVNVTPLLVYSQVDVFYQFSLHWYSHRSRCH